MRFGLTENTLERIQSVFARFPQIKQAILYGSRAMNRHRDGSDIDLTFTGKELTLPLLARIESDIDDLHLAYKFDLSIFRQISTPSLINHIERVGIIFYERKAQATQQAAMKTVGKAGWKTVRLGDVCKIVNGATPSTSVEANWGGPHCWITPAEMGGLSDPYVGETKRTLTDVGLADCSASLLPAGSVILSSRAPIGHVIINTVPMATNQGCKSMIPRCDLDAKFLFYFIKANVPLLESLGTGATFKELSGGKLASVEIPLPPLAEQKRIVALLDEAFTGIDAAKAKAEHALTHLKKLSDSSSELVVKKETQNLTIRPLRDMCEGVFTGPFGTILHKHDYITGGIPLVNPAHINSKGITPNQDKTVSRETANRLNSYL